MSNSYQSVREKNDRKYGTQTDKDSYDAVRRLNDLRYSTDYVIDTDYINQYLTDHSSYWSRYGAGEDPTDYRLAERRAAIDAWMTGALADGTIDQDWYDEVAGILNDSDRYVGMYQGQRDFNSYLTDWEKWYNDSVTALDGMDWESGRGGSAALYAGMDGFSERDAAARQWLETYKDQLGPEYYSQMSNYLNRFGGYVEDLSGAYDQNAAYYNQWESQKAFDDDAQVRGWAAEYAGKSYYDLERAMESATDPAERAWLEQYAPTVMTDADYGWEIGELNTQEYTLNKTVEELRQRQTELQQQITGYSRSSTVSPQQRQAAQDELNQVTQQLNEAQAQYEDLMRRKWQLEQDRRYEGLDENKDFSEISKAIAPGKTTAASWNGIHDSTYDWINNLGGYREEAMVKYGENDPYYNYWQMNQDEVDRYNYLYQTEGAEAAREYLAYLDPMLDMRWRETERRSFEQLAQESPILANALSVPMNLLGGAGFIDLSAQKMLQDITGEYRPINYYTPAMTPTYGSKAIRETTAGMITDATGTIQLDPEKHPVFARVLNGRGLSDVYQLGMSVIDSRVAGLTGNPAAATALLASSAATSGVLDALERGATDEQALQMGMWNGAFEALFEFVEVNNLLKGDPNWIKAVTNQAITEGLGEGFTSIANNIADGIIMADKSVLQKKVAAYLEANPGMTEDEAYRMALTDMMIDVGWDIIGGAASGGLSAGGYSAVGSITSKMQYNALPKQIKTSTERLESLGLDRDAALDASGKLFELGKQYEGQRDAFMAAYDPNQNVYQYANDFKTAWEIGRNNGNQEQIGKLSLSETQGEIAYELGVAAAKAKIDAATTTDEDVDTSYSVSEEGNTVVTDTGEAISIKGFSSVGKDAVLDIGNGKTIKAEDVSYESDDVAMLYETLGEVAGSTRNANNILEDYRKAAQSGMSASDYAAALRQTYDLGVSGQVAERQLGNYELAGKLGVGVRSIIFSQGRKRGDYKATAKQAVTQARGRQAKGNRQGTFHFERNGRTFSKTQEASLGALEGLSKALGVDIHIYESYDEGGKRVYQDRNGEVKSAPNGWYDTETGAIHIDLNAGNFGQGTMMFTAAHELTHFIKDWSPVKFRKLADLLVDRYAEQGVSVRDLIDNQIAKAEKNGRTIDRDTAFEEVVADSMETMLTQGDAASFMAELKQQDKTLWEKVRDWFKDLAEKLRGVVDAYQGYTPDSPEGRIVAQMEDFIGVLQEAYSEALMDASENYRANEGKKNTTLEGGDKYQTRSVNGKQVVWIQDNVLKQNTGIPEHQFVANYIAGHIGEIYTIIESGQKVYIGEDLPSEFTQSKYTQSILKNRSNIIRVKNRSAGNIGEMIEIATNRRWEKAKHPENKDAKYGMYRYDTMFGFPVLDSKGNEVGANIYKAELVIRNASDGKKYLYDIVSIKKDATASGWLTNKIASAAAVAAGQKGNASVNKVSQQKPGVKTESTEKRSDRSGVEMTREQEKATQDLDVTVDAKTESVAPSVLFSERTWTASDYVQEREKAALAISKAIGVTKEKAKQYIDDINSIAKMIADDRTRLDYFSSPNRSSFVGNVEYGGSFDFSTLCKKRRLLTGTFTAIQKALPNTALTANEILEIRNRMKEAGLEVSCGLCYVEGSRANMGQFAKEFLRLYKQYYPDAWQPNMADVNTPDGIEWVRINHPECYEQYEYFWNHYGTLKSGDKNLFASQQKPKLYQLHTEYKGEILQKFDADNVEDKNKNGGIRLQSFSDFEIVHLIDTMQIIMDMSRVGLNGQAYTKVPDFAWALGDTGLKINLSLIAKGVDENGNLIFDDVEGMPIKEAMRLRERYSENVGTILVAFNDQQLMAAMADDRVDFIIPFHRSQWKKSQYEAMGLPAKTKDYTFMQNEKFIKPQYHEYRGRMVRDKATNYMPNEYWDFSKSGKENAEAYLEMCARNNKRPKFYKLLTDNHDGSYSLKADGSTDGYWKLLIDFKMYDNQGKGSPQRAVTPDFNMTEANRMLNEYKGGHSSFPVAQGIVDKFVEEYKGSHKGQLLSDRDPTAAATAQELEKQNAKLRQDVKDLRELLSLQGKLTKGTEFRKSSIEAAVKGLAQTAGATLDADGRTQLYDMLKGFYRYIASDENLAWDGVREEAGKIADFLQSNVKFKPQKSEYANDVLGYLRGQRVALSESQRAEVEKLYGYENYRRQLFGAGVYLSKDGISLDSLWHEAAGSDMFPGTFDMDILEGNQPAELLRVIDGMREDDGSGALEYAYNRDFIRQDLIQAVYDSYWRVDNLHTVADRKQREINEIRRNHNERMDALKESHQQTVKRLKEERRADIQAVREAYQQRNARDLQKARERYAQARERGKESRAAASQRQIVEKAARDMMDMLRKPTKDAHVPMALQKPLEKLLDSIDFTSNRAAAGGEPTIRDVAYTRALQDVKLAIAAQRTALEGDGDGTFSLDVPKEFLDQIDAHIKMIQDATEGLDLTTNRVYEMSSDELRDLAYILKTINRAVRQIDKLHMEGAKARVSDLAKSTVWEMGRRTPVKTEDGGAAMWANYTPTFAFERMGSAATQILDGLKMGQAKLARTADAVIKFTGETYTNKEVTEWEKNVHEIKLESGKTVKMTTAQIMSFYCLSRREQAKGHLNGGGIRMGNIDTGRNEVIQREHYRLTQNDIAKINEMLTDRQIEVANKLQRYMADVGGKLGNEISMARWDYMEMTDKDYFPIRSDSDIHDARNPDQDKANLWGLLNKGFTKAVVKGANDAMIVSSVFDVFSQHMSEMAEYNAFALPLVDAMKWYNYRETQKGEGDQIKTVGVKKALNDALGTAAGKYFIDLMTDINSSQKAGRFENFFGKLLSRSKAASVGWNLRVAIQQPTAILRASVYLDPKNLLKGITKFGSQKLGEEMLKHSGIALWKSLGYYDLNISRGITDQIKGDTTLLDKMNDWGMWLPGQMDRWTWTAIWAGCKAQVQAEKKLTGEALLEETAKQFENLVYHTQVADSVLTRSSIMRSKSQTIKELTSFMAEPTMSANLLLSAFQDYREGVTKEEKAKRTMRIAFCGYVLSGLANALVTAFADAARDDDEYEGFWEKYFQALLGEKVIDGNLFAELNPLEKIVFVRDILSIIQGYEGSKNPFMELVESCIGLFENVGKFMQGKGSLTAYGLIYQGLQVLGSFTGAAPANMLREVTTIWNNTFGKWNNMIIHRYKTNPKEDIKNAYQSGALGKREAQNALIEQGVAVTDAYWMVKEWDTGNTSKYTDLYTAALNGQDISDFVKELTENGKTEKEVLGELKSQIGTWYTDPESDNKITREQAQSMLQEYLGMEPDKAEALLREWDMRKDVGFSPDSLKSKFMEEAVTEEEARDYLVRYSGLDADDAEERVAEWAFELEHGYSYDDIRQTYQDGEITADEARDVMMEVAGKTREQADYSLLLWDFEKENGWKYEDRASLYKDGKITRDQLSKALMDVGEYEKQDALYQVEVYDWEMEGLEGATIKRVQKWHEYCKGAGISKETFLDIQVFSANTKNDVDAEGKTINYSAMKKVMAEINRLPLSDAQKDALAQSLGWSEKNIRKYKPW